MHGKIAFEGKSAAELNNNDLIRNSIWDLKFVGRNSAAYCADAVANLADCANPPHAATCARSRRQNGIAPCGRRLRAAPGLLGAQHGGKAAARPAAAGRRLQRTGTSPANGAVRSPAWRPITGVARTAPANRMQQPLGSNSAFRFRRSARDTSRRCGLISAAPGSDCAMNR